MNAETQVQMDAIQAEMDDTLNTLKNESHPQAMMTGCVLAFRLLWKAIQLVYMEVKARE